MGSCVAGLGVGGGGVSGRGDVGGDEGGAGGGAGGGVTLSGGGAL